MTIDSFLQGLEPAKLEALASDDVKTSQAAAKALVNELPWDDLMLMLDSREAAALMVSETCGYSLERWLREFAARECRHIAEVPIAALVLLLQVRASQLVPEVA